MKVRLALHSALSELSRIFAKARSSLHGHAARMRSIQLDGRNTGGSDGQSCGRVGGAPGFPLDAAHARSMTMREEAIRGAIAARGRSGAAPEGAPGVDIQPPPPARAVSRSPPPPLTRGRKAKNYSAAITRSASDRDTETSWLTPRSAMVTPKRRSTRDMVSA